MPCFEGGCSVRLSSCTKDQKAVQNQSFLPRGREDVGRGCQRVQIGTSHSRSNHVICVHLDSFFGWWFQDVGFSSPEMLNPFQVGPAPSKIYCESPCAALRYRSWYVNRSSGAIELIKPNRADHKPDRLEIDMRKKQP